MTVPVFFATNCMSILTIYLLITVCRYVSNTRWSTAKSSIAWNYAKYFSVNKQ
jgi:hypothetical protein